MTQLIFARYIAIIITIAGLQLVDSMEISSQQPSPSFSMTSSQNVCTLNSPSSPDNDSCILLSQNDLTDASPLVDLSPDSDIPLSSLKDLSSASSPDDLPHGSSLDDLLHGSSLDDLPHTSSPDDLPHASLDDSSSLNDHSFESSVSDISSLSPASSLNELPCDPSLSGSPLASSVNESVTPSFTFPTKSFDPKLFSPLYPDANVTLCGAMCSIMQFSTANKLTYAAIDGLLKLLVLLCPRDSLLPVNFYTFKKFFAQFSAVHDQKKVCTKCMKIECSCEKSTSSDLADLINLDIHKPLETVITRK